MFTNLIRIVILLVCFISWNACNTPQSKSAEAPIATPVDTTKMTQQAPPPPPVERELTTSISIDVNKKGEIRLSGRLIKFDDLKAELVKELAKMSTIPNEIPVKFDEEILMGTRSEVRTEIRDALEEARTAQKKK